MMPLGVQDAKPDRPSAIDLEKVQREVAAELQRVRFEMDTDQEEIKRRSSAALLQEIRELRQSWEDLCRCKGQFERQAASVEGRIQFLTEQPAIELESRARACRDTSR